MEKKINKKAIIALFMIILLCAVRLIFVFAIEKTGFHSDELWGYGSANGYYEPFIYGEDDVLLNEEEKNYKNFNEWTTGEIYHDYITVQENERFSYGSVNYNLSNDNHPPLFFFVLHTICSFFPNTFLFWYGFAINLVSFVVLMIFMYKTAKLLTNSDFFALVFCAFFGLCDGALNLFVFVRMYAMATAIFSAFLYFMLRLIMTKNIAKNVPWLAFLVFIGAYTHHFYLVAVGIFTVFASLYFLFRKNIKVMLINGFSLLGAVGLYVLIYPAAITHLFIGQKAETMPPYYFSVKTCLGIMSKELFGVTISPYHTMFWDYIFVVTVLLLAIFVPIGFLVRKNEWVKANIFSIPRRVWTFFKTHRKTSLAFCLVCFLTSVAIAFVVGGIVSVVVMKVHTDRYLFVVYPALALSVAYVIYELLIHLIKNHKWVPKAVFCLILAVFVVVGTIKVGCIYLFAGNDDDIVMGETVEDADVVLALTRKWTLTCYTSNLMTAENVFVTDFNDCEDSKEDIVATIDSLQSDKPLYLVIETSTLLTEEQYAKLTDQEKLTYEMYGHNRDEMFDIFKNLKLAEKFEFVGNDHIFDIKVEIYKLKD